MELFGGKIASLQSCRAEIEKAAGSKSAIKDLSLILKGITIHSDYRNVLIVPPETIIDGDLVIDHSQKWIEKNRIIAIVCFGNLTIRGDLLNNDERYSPMLFVSANLSARNVLKGGLPLIVCGDFSASGYIVGEYNDGPMRIGGDLKALGFFPRVKDFPELKGHVIGGSIKARKLDMLKEHKRKELLAILSAEVIDHIWLKVDALLEKGRAGQSVWREAGSIDVLELEQPAPPSIPALNQIDPTEPGSLCDPDGWEEKLLALIRERVQSSEEGINHHSTFTSYIGYHFADHPGGKILVLPDGTDLNGDLLLDWDAEWVLQNEVAAIVCPGDLTVRGTIRNRTLEGGPMLFVGGNLNVDHLVKSGAPVVVLGDLNASAVVVCEYNDGVTRINGSLNAVALFVLDHDCQIGGSINAVDLNDERIEWWRDHLVETAFPSESDELPDAELIWAHYHAGIPLLLSG